MLISIPIILIITTSLVLILLRLASQKFRYSWLVAVGGSTLAFLGIFLWQFYLPQTLTLPAWKPVEILLFTPSWWVDGISWVYAISLVGLSVSSILTSVVRSDSRPILWAGTLLLTALGILSVSAGNPLTLILAWSAIDLVELFTLLRSADTQEDNRSIATLFAIKMAGTGLVLWANLVSRASGELLDFHSVSPSVGTYFLLAAGLRTGIVPLYPQNKKDNPLSNEFVNMLRLVSAGASLAVLARISSTSLTIPYSILLFILVASAALFAGWKWLRSSDEVAGLPYWVLGMSSLSIASSLRAIPIGSASWGIVLILAGGLTSLFTARQRSMTLLPLIGIIGLSTLPFSITAAAWQNSAQNSLPFILSLLPALMLLITGYIRHTLQKGETNFGSYEFGARIIYSLGISLSASLMILLGIWGWEGASIVGRWWVALIVLGGAAGGMYLSQKLLLRSFPGVKLTQQGGVLLSRYFFRLVNGVFSTMQRVVDVVTSALEGDGGVIWSLLLLALIFSILST